jgi:uridine kinase
MYTQQDIDEKVQECQRQVEQEIAMLQSSVTQKEEELVRLKKEYADMQ